MSFIDSVEEVLDRAESSLGSLIADALKAKAYHEITAIAALAESVAAIGAKRSREGRMISTATTEFGSTPPTADTARASEPSWMRPKTT